MKFDEKYPDAKTEGLCDNHDNVIKSTTVHPCWHCGEPTSWVEINFEAPLCSEECVDAKYEEYFKACKQGANDEKDAGGIAPF